MARSYRWPVPLLATAAGLGLAAGTRALPAARPAAARPDLIVDARRLAADRDIIWRTFPPGDCALTEGCVPAPGRRRLLRFTVATPNIGAADLILGRPQDRPDLFVYSPCHRHYHFAGYASYVLSGRTARGPIALTGRKQAFCVVDSERYRGGSPGRGYSCDRQGISVGWQDVYARTVDCQWLDITGVPPGTYTLAVTVNPQRILPESDYANNGAQVAVTIPPG